MHTQLTTSFRLRLLNVGACLCALSFAACQNDKTPGGTSPTDGAVAKHHDAGSADAAARDSGAMRLSFSSCRLEGHPDQMAECATATVPAVWSDPKGDTIDVFVKRYPAAQQPAKGQLWLLNGGPGAPGSVLDPLAFFLARVLPELDFYMPDHRGTGKSAFATCGSTTVDLGPPAWPSGPSSLTPAAAAQCAAAIPHLQGLTPTDAAKDLALLIDATRAPSDEVFVYGMSYGTYWAQRYLQIRPDQPTAVVLDSTMPSTGMDFSKVDERFDAKAHAVLDLCKADATCSAKLGPDPAAKGKQAFASLDAGTCDPGVGPLGSFLGNFVTGVSLGYFDPMLLPASIYRILRCNSADVAWFGKVSTYVSTSTLPPGFSDVTNYNVALSELWPTNNPDAADLKTQEQTMIGYLGLPPYFASLAPSWPKAPRDSYYGKWPSSPAPTLVLQGTMDPNTPFGDLVKPHYSSTNQYFVEFPNVTHVVLVNAFSCASLVMQSFLNDPSKAPDTSCIASLPSLDFGKPDSQWLAGVGVQDLWENP
jgi:pimeloyl-ACP methyl ester carboxylesterase